MLTTMPLCQIALSTMDLTRTSQWYCNTFGWRTAGEKRTREGEIWARVPGLPEANFTVWWLIEKARFFQFELFEFHRPRMRAKRSDSTPADLGYASVGLTVPDLDLVMDRVFATGGVPLTEPIGTTGQRRVCLRDPDGALLELMESSSRNLERSGNEPLATVNSIRVSVRSLDRALRFWVDALGLEEQRVRALHQAEHESLWGLSGERPATALLRAGELFVELVEYDRSRQRNKEAGHLLSDQGILNIALGTTDLSDFDTVFQRALRAGYMPCSPPWTVPGIATVVYVQDGQGLTVELLHIEPNAMERMGFASNEVAPIRHSTETAARRTEANVSKEAHHV